MKLKLLFLLIFISSTLCAQNRSVQISLNFNVQISEDSGIDPSTMSVTISGGEIINSFEWDEENNLLSGLINVSPNTHLNYSIASPDNTININGYKVTEANISNGDSMTVDIHLTDVYKVTFELTEADCEFTIGYINASDQKPVYTDQWVYTNVLNGVTYLWNGNYSVTPYVTKNGSQAYCENIDFEVNGAQCNFEVPVDFSKLFLVTFTLEDIEGNPMTGASITLNDLNFNQLLDEAGKTSFYLPNGPYNYAPQINNTYWKSLAAGFFNIESSPLSIKYSFKDEGWNKMTFLIEDIDMIYTNLSLSTIGGSTYSEYYKGASGDDGKTMEVIAPAGEYKYNVWVRDKNFKTYPALEGSLNHTSPTTTVLSFANSNFISTSFTYKNRPAGSSLNAYSLELIKNGQLISQYSGNNPSCLLTPGKYDYICTYNESYVLTTGSFEIEEGESSKQVSIDVGSSAVTFSVSIEIKNRPAELLNKWLTFSLINEAGIAIGQYSIPGYSNQMSSSIRIPKGKYHFAFSDYIAGADESSFIINSSFETNVTKNYQSIQLDFNNVGKATFDFDLIPGMDLSRGYFTEDGVLRYEVTASGNTNLTYFAPSGDYGFRALATANGKPALMSNEKAFTLTNGSSDNYIIDFNEAEAGIMMQFLIEDMNGRPLETDAVVTINDEAYTLEAGMQNLMLTGINADQISYKVESQGYNSYETSFAVTDIHRNAGRIYVAVSLSPTPTGIGQVQSESIRIETNMVDQQIVIYNDGIRSWNASVVSIGGQTLVNERIVEGVNYISINQLSKGHYILMLTDGEQKKSVRIIKK